MLDVIHVLFEEDIMPTWEKGAEVKDEVRKTIYRTMYNVEYKHGMSGSTNTSSMPPGEMTSGLYSENLNGPPKPFFPASSEDELHGILGKPMGE